VNSVEPAGQNRRSDALILDDDGIWLDVLRSDGLK
jgi:hypothetical protein